MSPCILGAKLVLTSTRPLMAWGSSGKTEMPRVCYLELSQDALHTVRYFRIVIFSLNYFLLYFLFIQPS